MTSRRSGKGRLSAPQPPPPLTRPGLEEEEEEEQEKGGPESQATKGRCSPQPPPAFVFRPVETRTANTMWPVLFCPCANLRSGCPWSTQAHPKEGRVELEKVQKRGPQIWGTPLTRQGYSTWGSLA